MDQIFVFFPDDEKVGVKPIRSYSEKMQEEDVKKAIIVIKGGITPFARSAIQELCAQREVRIIYTYTGNTKLSTRQRASRAHIYMPSRQKSPPPLLQKFPLPPAGFGSHVVCALVPVCV